MKDTTPNPYRRIAIALVCLAGCLIAGAAAADVRIASWNTRHLGWANHKDETAMARVIGRFDLVALQEVMKPAAAERLAQRVGELSHEPWGVITSHTVGAHGYKEGYAFLWRQSAIHYEGGATLYLDPGDHFVREPFSARFREAGAATSFVAATVHIKYGDSQADRTPEIQALADYWQWLGQAFPDTPRLLMGDFNTPPTAAAWAPFKRNATPRITTGRSTLSRQPGEYAHLYDNIWTSGGFDVAQTGIADYPTWLGISHKRAYTLVSDHAPVYIATGRARVVTTPFAHTTAPTVQAAAVKHDCIDINTANAAALDQLDEVGPARANQIIQGRPWASLEALTAVRGLSAARVDAIRAQGRVCPF